MLVYQLSEGEIATGNGDIVGNRGDAAAVTSATITGHIRRNPAKVLYVEHLVVLGHPSRRCHGLTATAPSPSIPQVVRNRIKRPSVPMSVRLLQKSFSVRDPTGGRPNIIYSPDPILQP
jgi:hypothetical protein